MHPNALRHESPILAKEAKMLPKTKFYGFLLVAVMLAGAFSLYAEGILTNSVTISNTGQIGLTYIVRAASGSISDVQTAVNNVASNAPNGVGEVIIPQGTWLWDNSTLNATQGVSLIGQTENQTIIRQTQEAYNKDMISYWQWSAPTTQKTGPTEVANLTLDGCVHYHSGGDNDPQNEGLRLNCIVDYYVHNCVFYNFTNMGIDTNSNSGGSKDYVCRGVISHCTFDNPYKTLIYNDDVTAGATWGYGIIVEGTTSGDDNSTWGGSNAYGNYGGHENQMLYWGGQWYNLGGGISYIEDCSFNRCRHCIAGGANSKGYYVARYNFFNQSEWYGYLDAHGGSFGFEAYNNTINATWDKVNHDWNIQAQAFHLRGGYFLIYNNTVVNVPTVMDLFVESQPYVNDTWIWSNNCINYRTFLSNTAPSVYVENQSYWLYGPKAGYTAYLYPFPFVTGSQLPPAWDVTNTHNISGTFYFSVCWKAMQNPYAGLTNTLDSYYLEYLNNDGSSANGAVARFSNIAQQWTNFTVTPPLNAIAWRIHANNSAGQWSTFCYQYFAAAR